MFWTEKKLAARLSELDPYRYRDIFEISSLNFQLDVKGEIGSKPPLSGKWSTIHIGETWSGRDLYAWLSAAISIPHTWENKTVVGVFDFGITDEGHNSGFESLLYINGSPYQGVDANHKEVFFSGGLYGKDVQLDFRLWSGLEGGGLPTEQIHKFKKADIGWMDEAADDLFFTSKAALQTVEMMNENRPERSDLLGVLNYSFNQIDWTTPGSDEFYQSIYIARDILKAGLEKIEKHNPITIHAVGHTHIDVAWLWRLRHTREKAARSFSSVLRLMEKYPEYIFQQAQPQLYEYIKEDYPEIYGQIQKRVREGRWEADGGMWLEPDCNLPSGESFVRQLLHGTRFLKKEFGVECSYLWLPDVFGYSWALPQILQKAGIKSFVTTKISWNQYNRMPHDVFKWRGIDGSEILTYFITTPYPGPGRGWGADYNAQITAETVLGAWEVFKDKGITKDLMITYGHGDGGGGVTREMLEMRRRLDEMPGVPQVKTSKAGEFLETLHRDVDQTNQYVHTWDGELYLEFHRGTYTSQAYNKKTNRKLEILYRRVEMLNVFASVSSKTWSLYQGESLYEGWKIILRNQFHDIIPGSSINEVYKDSREEYANAENLAKSSLNQAAQHIITNNSHGTYTVINDASWNRHSLLFIPIKAGMEKGGWLNHKGEVLQAEKTADDWIICVPSPQLGHTTVQYDPNISQLTAPRDFIVSTNEVHTPFYEIKWNETGQLSRIYDVKAGRDILKKGQNGNVLQIFEDKPLRWDAWDIDIFYQEKMKTIEDIISIEISEVNSLRTVVQFTWKYNRSIIKQSMILYSNSRRIDFKTDVDWHEKHQLLKVAFPVNIRATEATYDIQFGNVKRPQHWNTSWDYAKFETVGHQWADVSERGYGVSLLNDSKYGYDIKDSVIRLSLLRGATYPDHSQDQGNHIFTYSLLPHQGSWVEGSTVQEAWDLNSPLSYLEGKAGMDYVSLFNLSADYVVIDAIKKAEDSNLIVLRLHEYTGRRGIVEITSDLQITRWQECDLLERAESDPVESNSLMFEIKPYEIKTFLVNLSLD